MKSKPSMALGSGIAAVLAVVATAVLAGTSVQRWIQDRKRRNRAAEMVDEAVDESFPASDPPSHSATLGATPQR